MDKKHVTADGKLLFICQMDNDHLRNTINLIIKNMNEHKKILSMNIKENFTMTMNGVDSEELKERAKEIIVELEERLCPYIYEASIRGISFSEELKEFYERTGQVDERDINLMALEYGDDF